MNEIKIKLAAVSLSLLAALSLSSCSADPAQTTPPAGAAGSSSPSTSEAAPESEAPSEAVATEPEASEAGAVKSGSYTLPCGLNLNFSDSVRNDVTGKWRLATTADSMAPADCALEYYEALFSSDDEIHAVWNATLGTMTRITASGGLLFVDTLEYVKGEEHDANLLFSGELLDSRIYDIATGEPVDLDE